MQTEALWVDKDGRRTNLSVIKRLPAADGSKHPNGLTIAQCIELGYSEITISEKPDDYSDETYTRDEEDFSPYVKYTKKSPEALASLRWTKLKQIRDELTDSGGCLVQGKWFHTDVKSKQQQIALTMLGDNIPDGLQWKTMDGTFIEMTPAIAAELFASQIAREVEIFNVCETKRLDDTPVNDGWPAHYEVTP